VPNFIDLLFKDQLVELRTVMEKLRPIDQKLKYQIEKLLRNATEGRAESDPLQHKANLDDLEASQLYLMSVMCLLELNLKCATNFCKNRMIAMKMKVTKILMELLRAKKTFISLRKLLHYHTVLH